MSEISISSMYDVAIRNKLRFDSPKGLLSLEALWDVPLASRNDDTNLNTIAKIVNKELKEITEENFTNTRASPDVAELNLKLGLVKHVIFVKETEEEKRKKSAANKLREEHLLGLLEKKQGSKDEKMSEAAIKKELAELRSDD